MLKRILAMGVEVVKQTGLNCQMLENSTFNKVSNIFSYMYIYTSNVLICSNRDGTLACRKWLHILDILVYTTYTNKCICTVCTVDMFVSSICRNHGGSMREYLIHIPPFSKSF